jgi:hypothetical protein
MALKDQIPCPSVRPWGMGFISTGNTWLSPVPLYYCLQAAMWNSDNSPSLLCLLMIQLEDLDSLCVSTGYPSGMRPVRVGAGRGARGWEGRAWARTPGVARVLFLGFFSPRAAPFRQSKKNRPFFRKKTACGRKHDFKTKTEVPAVVFAYLACRPWPKGCTLWYSLVIFDGASSSKKSLSRPCHGAHAFPNPLSMAFKTSLMVPAGGSLTAASGFLRRSVLLFRGLDSTRVTITAGPAGGR